MAGDSRGKERVVIFTLENKTVEVTEGTTLLQAARLAGIELDAVCGGDGKCGRCKVRPEGHFSGGVSPLLSAE